MNTEYKPEIPSLSSLLNNPESGETYILARIDMLKKTGWYDWFFNEVNTESHDSQAAYPSQGLVRTPYDGELIESAKEIRMPDEELAALVPVIIFYLEAFNHPDRISNLNKTPKFARPKRLRSRIFSAAEKEGRAISINNLGLSAQGHKDPRIHRTDSFAKGPFVRLGKRNRSILVGSANPEIFGSAPALAYMAQTHSMVGLPRDGLFVDINRQRDLAVKAFEWLNNSPVLIGRENDRDSLLENWRHNIMGVLEVNPEKALLRAEALYDAGVRTFRLYSPEPGCDLADTTRTLKNFAKKHQWQTIEIFAGQVVEVGQARELEKIGVDGLYVGIGGGGRCKTGVRSGLVIDWPQLLWKLRGRIHIPVIVEGGASDQIAETLAVGGTGIGVTRAAGGGTIESPGGLLYLQNGGQKIFKPYGGEASARIKSLGGKAGPFGIIPYVEGETTVAYQEWERGVYPTLLEKVYTLNGDAIMALVFQNAPTIAKFQQKIKKTLRITNMSELELRHPHG